MTPEERMAYFQGQKRRTSAPAPAPETREPTADNLFFKLKFITAIFLFIAFLSLDYTGYKIKGIGSGEIIQEVSKDFEYPISFPEFKSL